MAVLSVERPSVMTITTFGTEIIQEINNSYYTFGFVLFYKFFLQKIKRKSLPYMKHYQFNTFCSVYMCARQYTCDESLSSGKHVRVMYTPLNPTFM